MTPQKRYQIFVSSTFDDLKRERFTVLEALLRKGCIPTGMEYFPSSNQTPWDLITKMIDDCDYYVVFTGGKYGSEKEGEGKSYTECEYDYAISKGKHVLPFVHADINSLTGDKLDKVQTKVRALETFNAKISKTHRRAWKDANHLAMLVNEALDAAFQSDPQRGWIRGTIANQNQPEVQEAVSDEISIYEVMEECSLSVSCVILYSLKDGMSKISDQNVDAKIPWYLILLSILPKCLVGCSMQAVQPVLNKLAHEHLPTHYQNRNEPGYSVTPQTLQVDEAHRVMGTLIQQGHVTITNRLYYLTSEGSKLLKRITKLYAS